ncbi:MAG: hypothetical protein ABSB29_07640 [Nitrososphaerales archaeon]
MVPPYLIELTTEYFYFTPGTPYFFFSSLRLYFFVIYIGIASVFVGRRSSNLRLTWLSCATSILGLFLLLYIGCNPRVCYNTGIDGLEPLRSYSFFLAEGVVLSAAGFPAKNRLTRIETALRNSAAFYSIAYYPVIFTVAGVKLVAPVSPLPVLGLVALLSFVTSARVFEEGHDRRAGLAVPIITFLVLSSVSVGIAAQYTQQAIPLMGILLACVVAASLLGVLGPVGGREAVRRVARSKVLTAGLVGVLLLSMVVIQPDAVNGTAPNLVANSYHFQTPVVVGGFMSDPYVGTKGVSANFSFQGTDASSIQPNNFLAAGIGIHSPNCCVDGIDYGYRADVFLYHNASEVFAASAWEVCDTILACGGHTWKHLMYFSWAHVNSSLESSFQLSVEWEGHTVSWLYSAGSETRLVASFAAQSQENPAFDAGWLGPSSTPSPGGWPFFQFGVMSAFPIDHPGWRVTVACPSIVLNSTWVCIDHAEFFQGDSSFWKALWRWGENYPSAGATVNPGSKTMTFQYSQVPAQDFQTAW